MTKGRPKKYKNRISKCLQIDPHVHETVKTLSHTHGVSQTYIYSRVHLMGLQTLQSVIDCNDGKMEW